MRLVQCLPFARNVSSHSNCLFIVFSKGSVLVEEIGYIVFLCLLFTRDCIIATLIERIDSKFSKFQTASIDL